MNTLPLFEQHETCKNIMTLPEHVQLANPSSLDFDEDNKGLSWGHYQFMAGGLSPTSVLTTWKGIGSVATTCGNSLLSESKGHKDLV